MSAMMQMQSRGRVFGGAAPQTARQSVVVVRAESRREGGVRQTAEQIVRWERLPNDYQHAGVEC